MFLMVNCFLVVQRPFTCYVDDCTASYRRKDHLNRHLLTHKGKLFKCPVENCKSEFSIHGNISKHVKKFHTDGDSNKDDTGSGDSQPSECSSGEKKLVCKEVGCGKAFKYPSQLQKHEDSHGKTLRHYMNLPIIKSLKCYLWDLHWQ